MDIPIKDDPKKQFGQPGAARADTVSAARRRVIKTGLAVVPAVVTLKGRPLLGGPTKETASITASIQASRQNSSQKKY